MDQPQKKPSKIRGLISRFRRFIDRHRIASLLVLGLILVGVTAATALFLIAETDKNVVEVKPMKIEKKEEPKPKFYSPLTGIEIDNESDTKKAVTAIMIENSPDARPQSGIKQSGVVYEAIAEGGITRFLILYQQDKPQLVGPVRSLRMYYVDWLAPYNASVAHVGGSLFALQEVRNGKYRDIDQFFNAGTYWRATDRYAPHNVYTSFKNIDDLNKAKGYTSSEFTAFPRADGKPAEKPNASSVSINISSPMYNSTYKYDAKTNSYARSQGGAPHLDREAGQIAPSVIIALKVNMNLVMEDGYREQITTTGKGEAIIFQNGTAQTVTWSKPDRASQISFIDADGKPVSLVRGQTWISAVPNGSGSISWQ